MNRPGRRALMTGQAAYYILSGALPLVSRRAFEAITGKKTDFWLVQMVGLLAVSIGSTMALALMEDEDDESLALVGLSTMAAASFAAIDVVHVARRRISPIYLLDAVAEVALLALVHIPDGD
jgi:hypothetical protein